MKTKILIKNNLIEIPNSDTKGAIDKLHLCTVVSNILYYGYILSEEALKSLQKLPLPVVVEWYTDLEKTLKEVTGVNKRLGDFIVYKNFPKEVLDMSLAEYWYKQIFMYFGFDKELFRQEEVKRDPMFEKVELKVLHLSNSQSLQNILNSLLQSPSRWIEEQKDFVNYLALNLKLNIDLKKIPFKENLVDLASTLISNGVEFKTSSATDVLRLAVAMSDGDLTFQKNTKFRNFCRKERKFLLKLLNETSNLQDDVARDTERWKRFLRNLHPSDYKQYSIVYDVAYKLYNDDVRSFNSQVEILIKNKKKAVFTLLNERPGDFVRRLHKLINVFGKVAVDNFISILPKLKVIQLLKIQKYIETIINRNNLTIAPKGNWTKLQILQNTKSLKESHKKLLLEAINKVLATKLNKVIKTGVNLNTDTNLIKIQTNDSDLCPYGRGTVFNIPENINFIRTASYWKVGRASTVWFDNGWNFFDENWLDKGACCWTDVNVLNGGAIYAGDPVSGGDMKGRAAELIDIYLDKLKQHNVRYAVWNILCYSRIPFSKVEDVFAALQWGEQPQKGKLFEPSRCQLSFPLKGDNFTKYVAVIDLKNKTLTYIDANLKANVSSARHNSGVLEKVMPAFMEYLDTLPSVYNLFSNVKKSKKGVQISYSDENISLSGEKAYIFKPVNPENKFEKFDITNLLNI